MSKYDTQEDWIFENVFLKRGMIEQEYTEEVTEYDERTYVDGYIQKHWLQQFFSDGGDSMLYNMETLSEDSVVLDVGSYTGEYSIELNKKYGCKCYGFEPIKDLYRRSLVHENENIKFFNFGLGNSNKTLEVANLDDRSSIYLTKGNKELCTIKNVVDVINDLSLKKISLMKMNVEGGEFDILEEMIEKDVLSYVDNFLIQFHYIGKLPIFRRHKILAALEKTHEKVFYYPFVWEHWRRK